MANFYRLALFHFAFVVSVIHGFPDYYHNQPTVFPAKPFDAYADAATLRSAIKNSPVGTRAIADVLSKRTLKQRQEIAEAYNATYQCDLVADLKSVLSGYFEHLVVAMMTSLPNYYAKELNDAISGIGTDEDAIIEILCTLTNYEIHTVSDAYEQIYGTSLEEDLVGDTSGRFRKLIVSLIQGNRDEGVGADEAQARFDAQRLFEERENQWDTDESVFHEIIATRNYDQLLQIFDEYAIISGRQIEERIKTEFSGHAQGLLLSLVERVRSKNKFFAKKLHSSMERVSINDRSLIRIIVARSEIDLGNIKEAFAHENDQSLESYIQDGMCSDFEHTLISLVH